MEISGFRAAAGKCLGVEFTVSLFHIVKLNFELLRLGVLSSWITFPSGDDVKARCEGQTAAHFIKINKVRFSVLRYMLDHWLREDIIAFHKSGGGQEENTARKM